MSNPFKKLKIARRTYALLAKMHFFGNPSARLKIVGVTGTNGKTTTATLLYRIAVALGHKAGLISTVENIIGGEKIAVTHTTPDPLSLNKLLKQMVEKKCEYVFMEVSSHAMDQNRLAGINFTGGIFSNLTHDHLDYHKNFENYFIAKKKFFKMLSKDAFALSNIDDERGEKMLENIKARKFSYGFEKSADFKGEIIKADFSGLTLKFNQEEVKSKLLGRFNAYNLLAIYGASSLLGFDMTKVKNILESIEPPKGRFEHFMSPGGVMVIIDYAHTPDALEKVLSVAKEIKSKEGRLIAVFGCGGDRDPMKRPKMGRIGASLSDVPIFTSDNPRSEDPNKIIADMMSDLMPDVLQKVKQITDRREAIKEAVNIAQKGDIIFCAGKGHEEYQDVKGVKHHFSDREEFEKLFQFT